MLKSIVSISIVLILFVIFGGGMKVKGNAVISIIGGADGPTSVFVAGKVNENFAIALIVIGIGLLGATVIAYLKRKHH